MEKVAKRSMHQREDVSAGGGGDLTPTVTTARLGSDDGESSGEESNEKPADGGDSGTVKKRRTEARIGMVGIAAKL